MAAKQGFTAHISQASEDAKRAVLSRAPSAIKSHSWLSNLNTTCTIKSAPPRTPEVMTLLSVKSGWLVKRNEQHVWQRRWCCVVPHMMMYYFEAEPMGLDNGGSSDNGYGGNYNNGNNDTTIVENQDILNASVRDGYNHVQNNGNSHHNRTMSGGSNVDNRSTTPTKGSDINGHEGNSIPPPPSNCTPAHVRGPMANTSNLQPVGIIDLECYSSVNRSSLHDCVFELTGDSRTNPDLRSFYFQAANVQDTEQWTTALLSDRHQALKDESDAYKQVCDSFQLQLQNMSDMIDEAEGKTDVAERELYNVRSQSQKFRNDVAAIVREALEQKCWGEDVNSNDENGGCPQHNKILEMARLNYLDRLNELQTSENSLRSSKTSGASPVQVLADYLATIFGSHTELSVQLTSTEQKLNQSTTVDNATVSDLKLRLGKLEAEREAEAARNEKKIAELEAQLNQSQKACEDIENQVHTQRMEFTMFQSQAKTKLQELSSHKKILKKEVIELRKKKEQADSERDAALHITDSHKMQAQNVKEKNEVLEKYIEKMENQVQVQQNMMEMISLSGMSHSGMSHGGVSNTFNGGSVVGRIIGAPDDSSFSSFGNMQQRMRDASPINRLPPTNTNRSRLPPGQMPVSIPNKKDNVVTSPSSHRKKKIRKFGADSFDTDDERFQIPQSSGVTSRGAIDLDSEHANGGIDHFNGTPVLNRHLRDEENEKPEDHNPSYRHGNSRRLGRRKNDHREQGAEDGGNDTTCIDNSANNGQGEGDSDDKTNVSELTEDRTQQFDSAPSNIVRQIHYTRSDTTGENIIDDGRGFHKTKDGKDIPVKYEKIPIPSANGDFPPRYILGANGESRGDGDDIDVHSTTKSEITMFSTTNKTKLSVAQKARIAASQRSNKVDVSSVSETLKLSDTLLAEAEKQITQKTSSPRKSRSKGRGRSQSPGVFSNLGKSLVSVIDNSIIGIKTTETTTSPPTNDASSTSAPLSPQVVEETQLTLVERKKLQRERQLKLLREKGLLKDDSANGGPEN